MGETSGHGHRSVPLLEQAVQAKMSKQQAAHPAAELTNGLRLGVAAGARKLEGLAVAPAIVHVCRRGEVGEAWAPNSRASGSAGDGAPAQARSPLRPTLRLCEQRRHLANPSCLSWMPLCGAPLTSMEQAVWPCVEFAGAASGVAFAVGSLLHKPAGQRKCTEWRIPCIGCHVCARQRQHLWLAAAAGDLRPQGCFPSRGASLRPPPPAHPAPQAFEKPVQSMPRADLAGQFFIKLSTAEPTWETCTRPTTLQGEAGGGAEPRCGSAPSCLANLANPCGLWHGVAAPRAWLEVQPGKSCSAGAGSEVGGGQAGLLANPLAFCPYPCLPSAPARLPSSLPCPALPCQPACM